jgi:long-subunit acyl-CoA synthetase (AMP-forming)
MADTLATSGWRDGYLTEFVREPEDARMQYQSLAAMFLSQADRYRNKVLYRFVEGDRWRSLTWNDAREQIREIALGLTSLGVVDGTAESTASIINR